MRTNKKSKNMKKSSLSWKKQKIKIIFKKHIKKNFFFDFKPIVIYRIFVIVSNSTWISVLIAGQKRKSEPRTILDDLSKPIQHQGRIMDKIRKAAVGMWQSVDADAFNSSEIQANPDLRLWSWDLNWGMSQSPTLCDSC